MLWEQSPDRKCVAQTARAKPKSQRQRPSTPLTAPPGHVRLPWPMTSQYKLYEFRMVPYNIPHLNYCGNTFLCIAKHFYVLLMHFVFCQYTLVFCQCTLCFANTLLCFANKLSSIWNTLMAVCLLGLVGRYWRETYCNRNIQQSFLGNCLQLRNYLH